MEVASFVDLKGKLKEIFAGEKKIKWIVAIGIAGILLILLSSYAPKKNTPAKQVSDPVSTDAYIAGLEKRLTSLIGSIDGTGRVTIMITADKSAEYVYVKEEKNSLERSEESDGSSSQRKKQEKLNGEEKYLLVEGSDGKNQALLQTKLEPEIKGVAVVCDGANNTVVQKRVIDTVTTVLGISSNRVCVIPYGQN